MRRILPILLVSLLASAAGAADPGPDAPASTGTADGKSARRPVAVMIMAEVPEASEESLERALDLLFAEVPEIAENDRRTRKTHPGRVIVTVESVPDPAAGDESSREWFEFAEKYDAEDHTATSNRFRVRKDGKEIRAYDIVTDSAITLAEWRKGRR